MEEYRPKYIKSGDNVLIANFGKGGRGAGVTHSLQMDQCVIDALSDPGNTGREERGLNYYRLNRVQDLDIMPGKVCASVVGSQIEPFIVTLYVENLSSNKQLWLLDQVRRVEVIEQLYNAKDLDPMLVQQLLPSDVFTDQQCTCPDLHPSCKHIIAVGYALAEEFFQHPYKLFLVHGILDVSDRLSDISSAEKESPSVKKVASPSKAVTKVAETGDIYVDGERFWAADPELYVEERKKLTPHIDIERGDTRLLHDAWRSVVLNTPESLATQYVFEELYAAIMSTESN